VPAQFPLPLPPAVESRLKLTRLDNALVKAASAGKLAEVKKLLAAGANPNAMNGQCRTALTESVRSYDVVTTLLAAHADPNLGYSPCPWPVDSAILNHVEKRTVDLFLKLFESKPKHRPPHWLGLVRKGVDCLGASKDEIVAWFGKPDKAASLPDVQGITTTYGGRGATYYLYDNGEVSFPRVLAADGSDTWFGFEFDAFGRCDAVVCSFAYSADTRTAVDRRKKVREVWSLLGPKTATPQISERQSMNWKQGEFLWAFTSTLPTGYPVMLWAESSVPKTLTRKEFSTKTDREEVSDAGPNPAFVWQDCLVSRIVISRPDIKIAVPKLQDPLRRY
jgi:hypothetical protein